MNQALAFLQGKKTYFLVACALAVAGMDLSGVIADDAANTALTVLGFGTIATLRAGITNALAKAKADAAAQAAPAAKPAA